MKVIGFSLAPSLFFLSQVALRLQSPSEMEIVTVLLSCQFGLFGNWSLLIWQAFLRVPTLHSFLFSYFPFPYYFPNNCFSGSSLPLMFSCVFGWASLHSWYGIRCAIAGTRCHSFSAAGRGFALPEGFASVACFSSLHESFNSGLGWVSAIAVTFWNRRCLVW